MRRGVVKKRNEDDNCKKKGPKLRKRAEEAITHYLQIISFEARIGKRERERGA
jgi:hypothetical protein